jgi:hypothetical protein
MLFVLDDSLTRYLEDGTGIDLISNSVELLTLSRREGKHILFGSRRLLSLILTRCSLSQQAAAMVNKVRQELPEFGNLLTRTPRLIRVVYETTRRIEERGGQRILYVPVTLLQDSSVCQKTILLGENFRDTKLYLMFAELFRMNSRIGNMRVVAEPRGGGGNEVVTEYSNLQNEQSCLCLCIVDSDRQCPDGSLGEVAKQTLAVDSGSFPMSEAFITRVRMIENHFSIRQLALAIAGNDVRSQVVRFLEKLEGVGSTELRKFIDFKNGIVISDINKPETPKPVRMFWRDELVRLMERGVIASKACLSEGECDKDPSCVCCIMPGFGPALLDNVTDILDIMTPQKRAEDLCTITRDEWLHIGGVVFAWCCARGRVVS